MAMTDPIADMITRIRNAVLVKKDEVVLPSSKIKKEIARVLKEEGYIGDFEEVKEGPITVLKCNLRVDGFSPITHLERVSKPGRRVYAKREEIPSVLSGHGLIILSTSKGVMAGKKARREGLGGELICKVY